MLDKWSVQAMHHISIAAVIISIVTLNSVVSTLIYILYLNNSIMLLTVLVIRASYWESLSSTVKD